jgi:hypothetical protein
MFSVRRMLRCYKQDKSGVVGQSPTSKNVSTKAEEPTALEAVTKQRLMKTEHTEMT